MPVCLLHYYASIIRGRPHESSVIITRWHVAIYESILLVPRDIRRRRKFVAMKFALSRRISRFFRFTPESGGVDLREIFMPIFSIMTIIKLRRNIATIFL